MSLLIRETSTGTQIARFRVAAPGYTLFVAQVNEATVLPDGWVYVVGDIETEDLIEIWVSGQIYQIGEIKKHSDKIWYSLLDNNVWEPGVTGWREETVDTIYPAWIQPLGAHDVWPLDTKVMYNGNPWISLVDNNVWEPGVANWRQLTLIAPSGAAVIPAWIQPTGAHDAYQIDDQVTYNEKTWISIAADNVWAPGVYGWVEI